MFTAAGFIAIPSRNVSISIAGRRGDVDSLFCCENVIVLLEDTMSASTNLGDHVRKTHDWCTNANGLRQDLFEALQDRLPRFAEYVGSNRHYELQDYRPLFVYASRYPVEERFIDRYGDVLKFLSFTELQYFVSLARTIELSARFELFKFLGLELEDIGVPRSATDITSYEALYLPESPSGFPAGHKLVSFLADPATLLERAYVLRADGWQDSEALYQRLLVKNKIGAMRNYLADKKRVFINNIIVTLPPDTKLTDERGRTPMGDKITPITVTLPRRFNTIGIIDGQHRVFAYHEGRDDNEKSMARLRDKQHLLVTGIVYPESMTPRVAQRFEAGLFLEINDKQTRVRGDLKQSIERLLDPFSAIAIAKAVIERLGRTGTLAGFLEIHFFDSGKIKTASIVSYGLRHIVRIDTDNTDHSLLRTWRAPLKRALHNKDHEALDAYVRHCATELSTLFGGFRQSIPDELWTVNQKTSRALTTTTVNGLIFCMRCLLEQKKTGDFHYYAERFKRLDIDFRAKQFPYKSSHWKTLGTDIFTQCFA